MARFKFPSKIWPDSARFQSLFSASSLWPDGTTSYHYPPEILIQSFLVIVTKHSIRKFLYIVVQNGNFLLKIRTQFFLLLHFMVILFSSRQRRRNHWEKQVCAPKDTVFVRVRTTSFLPVRVGEESRGAKPLLTLKAIRIVFCLFS